VAAVTTRRTRAQRATGRAGSGRPPTV
jgi:hypothetical protein